MELPVLIEDTFSEFDIRDIIEQRRSLLVLQEKLNELQRNLCDKIIAVKKQHPTEYMFIDFLVPNHEYIEFLKDGLFCFKCNAAKNTELVMYIINNPPEFNKSISEAETYMHYINWLYNIKMALMCPACTGCVYVETKFEVRIPVGELTTDIIKRYLFRIKNIVFSPLIALYNPTNEYKYIEELLCTLQCSKCNESKDTAVIKLFFESTEAPIITEPTSPQIIPGFPSLADEIQEYSLWFSKFTNIMKCKCFA